MFSFLTAIALLASSVHAHGTIHTLTIAGKSYTGNIPMQAGVQPSTNPSALRQIYTGEPIMDPSLSSMTCGEDAQLAKLTASAMPGDTIESAWAGEEGTGKWPHNVGPMFAYMASCGSDDCSNFNGSSAKWFKIWEAGQIDGTSTWYQGSTLYEGKPASYKLPSNIAPGGYLLRNEAIALQRASQAPGLAEFYPACAQINIGGSGTGKPQDSELVSFPGAYKESNSPDSFYTADIYNPGYKYTMPGPKVAAFVNGGASGNGGSEAAASAPPAASSSVKASSTSKTTKSTSTSSSAATPSSTGKKCRRKKTNNKRALDAPSAGKAQHRRKRRAVSSLMV